MEKFTVFGPLICPSTINSVFKGLAVSFPDKHTPGPGPVLVLSPTNLAGLGSSLPETSGFGKGDMERRELSPGRGRTLRVI